MLYRYMLRKKAKYGAKTSHSHGNFIAKVIDLFRYRDSTKKCPAKARQNVSKRRLFLKKRGVNNQWEAGRPSELRTNSI